VSKGAGSDMRTTISLHVIATSLNKRDFVVPPHDVAPVRLVVFLEFGVELNIFSDSHNYIFGRHSRVRLFFGLIPLAVLEMEGAHT